MYKPLDDIERKRQLKVMAYFVFAGLFNIPLILSASYYGLGFFYAGVFITFSNVVFLLSWRNIERRPGHFYMLHILWNIFTLSAPLLVASILLGVLDGGPWVIATLDNNKENIELLSRVSLFKVGEYSTQLQPGTLLLVFLMSFFIGVYYLSIILILIVAIPIYKSVFNLAEYVRGIGGFNGLFIFLFMVGFFAPFAIYTSQPFDFPHQDQQAELKVVISSYDYMMESCLLLLSLAGVPASIIGLIAFVSFKLKFKSGQKG